MKQPRIYLCSATQVASVSTEDQAQLYEREGYRRINRQQYNIARKVVQITRHLRRARGNR